MRHQRERTGYTIAEVIIALALFSLIALGLLGLFIYARVSSQAGLSSVSAASVGGGELNRLRTLPYASLVALTTTPMAPYNVTNQDVTYGIELAVQRLSATSTDPEYNLLDLNLQVHWQEKQSFSKEALAQQVTRTVHLHSTVSPTANF